MDPAPQTETLRRTDDPDSLPTPSATGTVVKPDCPRCGYDLDGVAPRDWQQSEAISSCSECGLNFRWLDLFAENHRRMVDFIELGGGWLSGLSRVAIRALRPVRFWKWVKIEYPIRPMRVAAAAAGGLLFWSAGAVILLTPAAIAGTFVKGFQGGIALHVLFSTLMFRFVNLWSFSLAALDPITITAASAAIVTPFTFVLLRQTLRQCRVRQAHFFRIAGYSIIGWPFVCASVAILVLALSVIDSASPAIGKLLSENSNGTLTPQAVTRHSGLWLAGAAWAWCLAWWWAALRWYVKLPHAGLTATLMVLMAVLISTLLGLANFGAKLLMWL